ncbi:hypothetical protein [Kitasatospora griseola]
MTVIVPRHAPQPKIDVACALGAAIVTCHRRRDHRDALVAAET